VLLGPDSGGLSQVCANVWRDDEHPGVRAPVLRAGRRQQNKTAQSHGGCFRRPADGPEREIKAVIDRFNADGTARLERELFRHRARLAEAGQSLEDKVTKKATESRRIASEKIEWTLGRLEDIRRTESQPRDSRIFPGDYAPVMVMENGQRVVKPMRDQCRIAGKPASYDAKYRALTSRAATVLKVIGSRFWLFAWRYRGKRLL
jgi:hypothetical protein